MLCLSCSLCWAQPWAKKASTSVFTLKTFAPDGSLLASSNGFFVGSDGESLGCFTPFKGASRAVVIDAQGKEWPVIEILGANDIYDVVKFRVGIKKPSALQLATDGASEGTEAWILPYIVKKQPNCPKGAVTLAEKFADGYDYYTLDIKMADQYVGCPLLNGDGLVIGLMQPSASQTESKSYAVSAAYANSMRISGLSINNQSLRQTQIDKAIPDNSDEAILSLFMAASSLDSLGYSRYLDRFIQKYPNLPDGYVSRARLYAAASRFSDAEGEMKQALKVAQKPDEVRYQYAELIYQKELYQADKPYSEWSLERALNESRQAYQENPLSVYRQQQAKILFAQKKYEDAYEIYDELTRIDQHNAETFYAAAQCKLQAGKEEEWLALLDSAVCTFSRPYLKAAAPYLLTRAQALHQAGKYRQAVGSFNDYAELMATGLPAEFYYQREQAEFGGHLFQQALDDIRHAAELNPKEYVYLAEKARVEMRVGLADDAIISAQQCISLDDSQSDGYLFLGIAQCVKGLKTEGLQNLQKAKELGNPQADPLIEKYQQK
jgi:tetratricopeptide (TPR) repeat protein